jgi:tryptophan synthase beta subunit
MPEGTKVEIGFGIGQVLSVKLKADELADLRKAVEAGAGWHDVRTQEGSVALNLATVVFIRVDDAAHSIGFAG